MSNTFTTTAVLTFVMIAAGATFGATVPDDFVARVAASVPKIAASPDAGAAKDAPAEAVVNNVRERAMRQALHDAEIEAERERRHREAERESDRRQHARQLRDLEYRRLLREVELDEARRSAEIEAARDRDRIREERSASAGEPRQTIVIERERSEVSPTYLAHRPIYDHHHGHRRPHHRRHH